MSLFRKLFSRQPYPALEDNPRIKRKLDSSTYLVDERAEDPDLDMVYCFYCDEFGNPYECYDPQPEKKLITLVTTGSCSWEMSHDLEKVVLIPIEDVVQQPMSKLDLMSFCRKRKKKSRSKAAKAAKVVMIDPSNLFFEIPYCPLCDDLSEEFEGTAYDWHRDHVGIYTGGWCELPNELHYLDQEAIFPLEDIEHSPVNKMCILQIRPYEEINRQNVNHKGVF